MKALLLCLSFTIGVFTAFGAAEEVLVVKVLSNDDKGIIQRANGEKWLIEKGVGALSFWRYEGKKVIINSPGLFCGVGSTVILPDAGQQAKIWDAKQLESGSSAQTPDQLSHAQLAVLALSQLGYFDPKSTLTNKTDPVFALKSFQEAKKLQTSGKISSETQLALARELLAKLPDSTLKTNLAVALITSSKSLGQGIPSGNSEGKETWIETVSSDGSIVKLADGSIYEVDIMGQIKTMLWLPTQKVLRLPDGLLHINKGQKVKATVIKQ